MFEVFSFIFNCIANICYLLDKFVLWKGFTYLDFSLALILIPCLFKVISIVRVNISGIDEEFDLYEGKHAEKYGGYKPRHGPYVPRHAKR